MEEVRPYIEKYGRDTCNAFFSYWTELSKDGEYMRFERRSIWQTENRLIAWARHGMKFDAKKGGKPKQPEVADSKWIDQPLEGEQRRQQQLLEAVPLWAYQTVKKHNLWHEGMTADSFAVVLKQLAVMKKLEPTEQQLLNQWLARRKALGNTANNAANT